MVGRSRTRLGRPVAVACAMVLALGIYGLGSARRCRHEDEGEGRGRHRYRARHGHHPRPQPGPCPLHPHGRHRQRGGVHRYVRDRVAPVDRPAGAKVKAAKGVKALGTTSDTHQVTSGGVPLHRFSLDTQAKQAKGEGVNAFGGTWHVVALKNTKTKAPATNAGTGGVSF